MSEHHTRLLILDSGPAMPKRQASFRDKFDRLSARFSGHIITPVMAAEDLDVRQVGSFALHTFVYQGGDSPWRAGIRLVRQFWFTVRRARAIVRGEGRPDVVVAANPLVSGLAGVFLGWLLRRPLVVEVNGSFDNAFDYEDSGPSLVKRLKARAARHVVAFTLGHSDGIKLLYEGQIDTFRIGDRVRRTIAVFHDFVPLFRFLRAVPSDDSYVLLVGHPWRLKGVDLLIEAFLSVADRFPTMRLKIVGWCPTGRDEFVRLARGHERIEFCDPVFYDRLVELMARCTVFVLPSRTEAMGRVLLEAMAAGKAIVASRVGGIPRVVRDGYNGLLCRSEDAVDLAEKLARVLGDDVLRESLGVHGREHVLAELGEDQYVDNYSRFVARVLASPRH
jgi:glycosyltransferase involved in cell wall biosynthesis